MRGAILLLNKSMQLCSIRGFSSAQVILNKPSSTTASSPSGGAAGVPLDKVQGLSQAVLTTNEPVGPGASKDGEYKVPEYFNYNNTSYFEAEVEMAKYRCPQPNAGRK